MRRRQFTNLAASIALPALAGTAWAQPKPMTIVVGYGAGSAVDIVARLTGERLTAALGRTVVVENRAGAGGQLAMTAVATAPPDGSLVVVTPPSVLTLFPATFARLPYNPAHFVPLGATCSVDSALVVGASHPAKSLAEFVTWAKANPAQCSIGNPGHATAPHFLAWRLAQDARIDAQYVSYRAMPQMGVEVGTGQLAAGLAALPAFMELIRAGRLRLLATAGGKRAPLFPDVPTFAEAGYPGIHSQDWYGFLAHAGVPQAFRTGFGAALREVLNSAAYRAQLLAIGFTPDYHDSAALVRGVKEDTAKWADLVKRTGFKASL